jgi:hypothetical protein
MKTYRDSSTQFRVSNIAKNVRYKDKYPEKVKAQQLASKIPTENECSNCGGTDRLERHHEDYTKPLEIITLCKMCHSKRHEKKVGQNG